jgi:hypothetical protein
MIKSMMRWEEHVENIEEKDTLTSAGKREQKTMYLEAIGIDEKVKLSLCLIKHYAMKAYGGVDV